MLGATKTIVRDNTPHRKSAKATVGRFWREEDGTLMLFGVLLFMLMLTFGGIAVDVMRYEQRRTALQQTIDRSVLAAASLSQERNPTGVVNDYFSKAGLSPFLRTVTVTEGLNFRNVNATAEAELPTFFMGMLGYSELDVPAESTAEQRINNVEIAMVLDVSGSMGGAKIANLKTAAMEFVDTVKNNDADNRISITLVPYNAQVNLPRQLREKYNATNVHDVTDINCLEIPDSQFSNVTLSRTTPIPMFSYADTSNNTNNNNSYSTSNSDMIENSIFCRRNNDNLVRLMSGDATQLKSWINGLDAAGNTSIVLGMKWALTLIEPGARPMMTQLIADGVADSRFAGRPFDWNDEDALKVIIVMTDGEHVAHTKVNSDYKTGDSPIWKAGDGNYSIQHGSNRPSSAGSNTYCVPHLNQWRSSAYSSGGTSRQTWQEVWAEKRVAWVAWQLYARALGTSNSSRNSWYSSTIREMESTYMSKNAMDEKLSQTCSLAKARNVVVYGIAFEAPTSGQQVIQDCATSESYYFNANGLEIQTAFRAIASNISQLRLTQ